MKNTQRFLFERESADDAVRILITFKIRVILLIFMIATFYTLYFFTLFFMQYCQCVHGLTFQTNPARNKSFSFSVHIPKLTIFSLNMLGRGLSLKLTRQTQKKIY